MLPRAALERRLIVLDTVIRIGGFGAAFERFDAQFRLIEQGLATRRERHAILVRRQ
jgi:hypothetical protein